MLGGELAAVAGRPPARRRVAGADAPAAVALTGARLGLVLRLTFYNGANPVQRRELRDVTTDTCPGSDVYFDPLAVAEFLAASSSGMLGTSDSLQCGCFGRDRPGLTGRLRLGGPEPKPSGRITGRSALATVRSAANKAEYGIGVRASGCCTGLVVPVCNSHS